MSIIQVDDDECDHHILLGYKLQPLGNICYLANYTVFAVNTCRFASKLYEKICLCKFCTQSVISRSMSVTDWLSSLSNREMLPVSLMKMFSSRLNFSEKSTCFCYGKLTKKKTKHCAIIHSHANTHTNTQFCLIWIYLFLLECIYILG